ncbi:MAG: ABC transporter substrate-binding protein [Acetanaerobacterium sp.]
MSRKVTAPIGFKRIVALLLCAIMALSLVACSTPNSPSSSALPGDSDPSATPAEGDATQITVWLGSWWADEAPRLEEEFAKANLGYTAKIELMPINNYVENASTSILGGNSPDALALDTLMIPTLVNQNLLIPMDDMMQRYDLTPDLYSETVYASGVTDGVNYAIPYRTAACGMLYNKTMFDKADVAYPTDRMDFDKFLDTCKALTIPGEQYGYGIAASKSDPANVMTSFAPMLWGFGGDFLTADLTKSALDTPESIAGIKYWVELYTTEKVVPEGCINYAITKDIFPLAMNQQIAMIPISDSNIVKVADYAAENNFEWDVCIMPGYARGAGWSFTIPVSAKNIEGAEIFTDWFTKPEVISAQSVVLPGVIEGQKMGKWADPIYNIFYEADKFSKTCPNTPKWTEIQNLVTQELQNALQGACTPEEAAKSMSDQINALLG